MGNSEIEKIRNAGVVGAGGAGFPTHVKLDAKVDTLIINAAECEPLIDVDKKLLENNFLSVYAGMKVAAGLTGAKRVVLALKGKYEKAISAIEGTKKDRLDFEMFKLDNFYPAGDEQVLVYEVTGRVVPEGGIPLQVGVVVINVETLLNVAASMDGRSVIEKYVTVGGEVREPQTLKVPVGTYVKDLVEYCGGINISDYVCLDGGPMMGKAIDIDEYAVKKTTKSIIVLPESNIAIEHKSREIGNAVKKAQAICLSCRMCTDLCPRYLLGHDIFPDEMMKRMYKGKLTGEDMKNFDYAYLCCDCGACELYSCVVDLSPRSLFNYIKDELTKQGIKNPHNRKDIDVNEFRQYRRIPIERLIKRLEIDKYHIETEIKDFKKNIDEVKIYLSQHVGVPSSPSVRSGEDVGTGSLIADVPDGKLGARIHSSIEGMVKEVNDSFIIISRK